MSTTHLHTPSESRPSTDAALVFRTLEREDYPALQALMRIAYADLQDNVLSESLVNELISLYPNGQLACFFEGQLIGASLNRIVLQEDYHRVHSEAFALRRANFLLDTQAGDSVYAIDFMIDPAYQTLKVGKKLHAFLVQQVFKDNFRSIFGVSRLTNYHLHQQKMSGSEYVACVVAQQLKEPILGFHLSNGYVPSEVIGGYNPEDLRSGSYGVTVLLANVNFSPTLPIYTQRTENMLNFLAGE